MRQKWKIVCLMVVPLLFLGIGTVYFYFTAERFVTVMAPTVQNEQLLLIIDPGHGGADGGASDSVGREEDEINLNIALRLEALALLYGLPVEMTRRTHDIDYPEDASSIRAKKVADTRMRVEQINAAQNAVVISIHQNTFPGDNSVEGTQVLYAQTAQSDIFAEIMQATLSEGLGLSRSRTPTRVSSSVFLMNHIDATAILVECGFLSNPNEAERLQENGYQIQIASSLLAGYVRAQDILRERYFAQ